MSDRMLEVSRQTAKRLAQRRGFDPKQMLICPRCGRTVIRKQKTSNPGALDSVYCTCDGGEPAMQSVVTPGE